MMYTANHKCGVRPFATRFRCDPLSTSPSDDNFALKLPSVAFAMPTNMLESNAPTPYHPNTTPQIKSGAKLSPSAAQSRNTSSVQLATDKMVDQLLIKAKSPLGEGGIQKVVEILEKVSREYLPLTDRCVQPAVDRCWSLNTK